MRLLSYPRLVVVWPSLPIRGETCWSLQKCCDEQLTRQYHHAVAYRSTSYSSHQSIVGDSTCNQNSTLSNQNLELPGPQATSARSPKLTQKAPKNLSNG